MSENEEQSSHCFSLSPSYSTDSCASFKSKNSVALTVSPPSYSVREIPNGKFFNETLKISWPSRPKEGYYSAQEYYHRKEQVMKSEQQRQITCFNDAMKTSSSVYPMDFLQDNFNKKVKWFYGTVSPLMIEVDKGSLGVFCPLAEPETSDIALVRKPILFYKNYSGVTYFMPIDQEEVTNLWHLKFLSYQSPKYPILKQLIDYVNSTGIIDSKSGQIEHIPYWLIDEAVDA